MRFVKQRRSCSLGVQSRFSNLGLQGDRNYWSKVLLGKKKSPFVPLIPEIQLFHLFYLFSFSLTYFKILFHTQKKNHTDAYTQLPYILNGCHSVRSHSYPSSVLSHSSLRAENGPQFCSFSSFILCTHNLNRWSPFDSLLFLPLSLWASASSYLSFYPWVPWHPFLSCPCCDCVTVCITLCRVLLSTYDFTLHYAAAPWGWICRNTNVRICSVWEIHKPI